MKILFFSICLFLFFKSFNCSILRDYGKTSEIKKEIFNDIDFEEISDAHYFTNYLNDNNIEDAKLKGLVNLTNDAKYKSYSGYFTVNPSCNNNLFSWFFEHEDPNAPVLLWLQGGPGGSSLFGLFSEIGPYYIDKDLKVIEREYAWTKKYSVLFIDNPVGTGFSYTNKDECYARNQEHVSKDLYDLLKQFFTIFKHLKNNPFYLTGESYAGKYIPSLAMRIHRNKIEAQKYFKFVGIAIGDGLIDPVNQLDYASLLKQIGMIDKNQFETMEQKKNEIITNIQQQLWMDAFNRRNELIDGDLGTISLYNNFTGLKNYFNFMNTDEPLDLTYYKKFLDQPSIKQQIHVGNHTYNDGSKVETIMREDVPKSVIKEFVTVLDNYKVLLYNGQLDIIVAPILTENFLYKMDWKYRLNFQNAERKIWKVDEKDTEVAGYIKSFDNLTYVVVRAAGHILPFDKPRPAFDLITKFIDGKLN